MIYYFTGTGNSEYVARQLAKQLLEMPYVMNANSPVEPEGESIGFVFPVYSWGVPPNVEELILQMPASFWQRVNVEQLPVWIVMTCGDEVAMAPEMIKKILKKVGVAPESIWSVIMPNNYVLLPGFNVDSKEVEQRKLKEAPGRIREIGECIKAHRRCVDVVRGSMPRLKTGLIYPLFKRWGISIKKWHSTDACVGCGICAESCPQCNIVYDYSGRPKWGPDCCSCLACYHSCPRHAIEYGKETAKKGQYFLPPNLRK
ncbi:MAG: EFR1 family ferrodoxin [Muribaculaceae bacterium]|nr:EFR1 family ferrodoxin [Muribaculaceae bacterium]